MWVYKIISTQKQCFRGVAVDFKFINTLLVPSYNIAILND